MRATAVAQPNIALIKYWGKRDIERNLPAVGSLSITLADLWTKMAVDFDAGLSRDELIVNGSPAPGLLPRLSRVLDQLAGERRLPARIESEANFPIAAGLASSASSFAALVVAATAALGIQRSTEQLASLAGQASGSAARSLFGGFVELGNTADGIRLRTLCEASAWPLRLVVAVTQAGPKHTGSTDAMEISRRTSPFYQRWIEDQEKDLAAAREAIARRSFGALGEVSEHNCLKMHSVMWSSRPPVVYFNDATLACLHTIRGLQADGVDVFFTIDAGPQVKAVCTAESAADVTAALRATDGVVELLSSGLSDDGARLV